MKNGGKKEETGQCSEEVVLHAEQLCGRVEGAPTWYGGTSHLLDCRCGGGLYGHKASTRVRGVEESKEINSCPEAMEEIGDEECEVGDGSGGCESEPEVLREGRERARGVWYTRKSGEKDGFGGTVLSCCGWCGVSTTGEGAYECACALSSLGDGGEYLFSESEGTGEEEDSDGGSCTEAMASDCGWTSEEPDDEEGAVDLGGDRESWQKRVGRLLGVKRGRTGAGSGETSGYGLHVRRGSVSGVCGVRPRPKLKRARAVRFDRELEEWPIELSQVPKQDATVQESESGVLRELPTGPDRAER